VGAEQSRYLAALQDTALLDAGLTPLRFVITSLAEDPVSAHAFQTYVETLFSLNGKLTARKTRNRKHRRAAAKPAACAPNAVNTREQGKEGGKVR